MALDNAPEPIGTRFAHAASASGRESTGFVLFLLVTAVLFVRPAEMVTSLEGLPIYNVLIVMCIVVSLPVLLRQVTWGDLRQNPTSLCVVLFLVAIMLSHLCRLSLWGARFGFEGFYKTALYYLLLVGLVNNPCRLRSFIVSVALSVLVIACLCLLQHHGVLSLPGITFKARMDMTGPTDDQSRTVIQLYGPGIFNDPNDLSLVLVASLIFFVDGPFRAKGIKRWAWLLPVPVVGYAFALTNSRGGFLAFLSGMGAIVTSRFGLRKSIVLALLILPLVLYIFAGRQTDISLDRDDTAYGRMALWREGFAAMKGSPVFGIGYGMYAEDAGLVAHNSFVHAFVETGLLGGIPFAGMFYVPWCSLGPRTGDKESTSDDGREWTICLRAILVALAVSLCSLSRCYAVSTYVIVGLFAAYCRVASMQCPGSGTPLSIALVRRLVSVGLGVLSVFYVLARLAA